MIDWLLQHAWLLIYWGSCMLIVTGWMIKNDEKIDSLQMFVVMVVVVSFLPIVMVASFIGKFIAAGSKDK